MMRFRLVFASFLLSIPLYGELLKIPLDSTDHTLHAFYFIDSAAGTVGDDIAPACEVGVELIDSLLKNSFPEGGAPMRHSDPFGDPHTYKYASKVFFEKLTPASILARLKPEANRSIKSGDSLMVFYCGHGSMNRSNHHFLSMAGGNLARTQLWGQMMTLHKSLTIGGGLKFIGLFTEACSNYVPDTTFLVPFSEGGRRPSIDPDILVHLFFNGGQVDMTSASPGQVGWSVGVGLFTNSLYQSLANKEKTDYWPDENSLPSWPAIFDTVVSSTSARFKEVKKEFSARTPTLRDAMDQVPYAWRLQYVESYIYTTNKTGEAVNLKYQVYQPEAGKWSPEFTQKLISNGIIHLWDLRFGEGTSIFGSHLRWTATTASGRRIGDWKDIDIRNFRRPSHASSVNRFELILK